MSQVRETGGGGVGERHLTYSPVWRYIMSHNTQISPKRVRFQGCESSTVHSFIINRLKPDVWYRASDRPLNGLLNASEAYLLDQLFLEFPSPPGMPSMLCGNHSKNYRSDS